MNDNWITVNRRGNAINNVHSQYKFFEMLKKPILNELLYRFNNNIIVNDINAIRNNNPYVDKSLVLTSRVSRGLNPSLFINYTKHGIQYFHFSIHLDVQQFNKKSNGVLHFKQNNTRKSRVTKIVNGNSINSIRFRIGRAVGNNLDNNYNEEAQIVLDVLNSYFDPENPKYLGKTVSPTNHNLDYLFQVSTKSINAIQTRNTRRTRKI